MSLVAVYLSSLVFKDYKEQFKLVFTTNNRPYKPESAGQVLSFLLYRWENWDFETLHKAVSGFIEIWSKKR